MKLARQENGHFVFDLGRREKELLLLVARRYPLVPATRHRVRQGPISKADAEKQQLLDAALAGHRQERRRQALALVNDARSFQPKPDGYWWRLSASQVEWLLQILNDVRVGSWLALGEPEEFDEKALERGNEGDWLTMEAAGHFETALLEALGVQQPPLSEIE